MGDTFRRISLGQRRKVSTNSYPDAKGRKRSALEQRSPSIEVLEHSASMGKRKISRPLLRMSSDEKCEAREERSWEQDSANSSMVGLSKDWLLLHNEPGCRLGGVMEEENDRQCAQGSDVTRLGEILSWVKEAIEQNEVMIQVVIVLPIILTALYIIFVEKGPLYVSKAS